MKLLLRFYDAAALVCFGAMFACIIIEVICRNFLFTPTTWAEEASRFFCVWSVFLGSASAWRRGSHIVIDVLEARIGVRSQTILQVFVNVFCLLFLCAIWWGALSIMKTSYPAKTTAMEISISYFYLGLFLGLTGMIIFQFEAMFHMLKNRFQTKRPGSVEDLT